MRQLTILVALLFSGLPSLLDAAPCRFVLNNQSSLTMEGPFLYARGSMPEARSAEFSDESWSTLKVPFRWSEALKSYRGEIWLRCHIALFGQRPDAAALRFSDLSDADEVYFNGTRIGRTGSLAPLQPVFSEERLYLIPAAAWQEENVVAIRLHGSSIFSGMKTAPVLLREGTAAVDAKLRFQRAALAFSILSLFFALFFIVRAVVTLRLRENLILAGLCTALGFYEMIRNGYRYEFFERFTTSFAVELLLLIPLPFLFYEFMIAWTERERPRFVLYIEGMAAFLWIVTAALPLLPADRLTTLLQIAMFANLLLIAPAVVAVVLLLRWLYKEERHRLKYPTIGFVIILPFAIHDMLVAGGLLGTPALFVFAFPAFLGAVAMQLAQDEESMQELSTHQNREKTRSERRKTEAIYNVSREFQLYLDGLRSALTKPKQGDKQLKQSISGMRQLLGDAKLLTALEDGTYELRQARFSLREQMRLVLNEVQIATNEKPSRFLLELPLEQERFWTDLALFQAIVYHLVENAVLHSTGRIQIRAEAVNGQLHMAVRDEGPGIATEAQEHIFEKFYRSESVKVPGSGIGLTIVDLAVQTLQGRLHLESGPGFFTVFDVELPEMQEVNV